MVGVLLVGELAQVPHPTRNDAVPGGYLHYLHRTRSPGVRSGQRTHASVDHGGSGLRCRGVVTGNAGQLALECEHAFESNWAATCIKIRGSVVSLSLIFPHPPSAGGFFFFYINSLV